MTTPTPCAPSLRVRLRAAALALLLVGGFATSLAVGTPAYAETTGSLHLHQSDDCSGPALAPGATVNVPFSISFDGFTPNLVGVYTFSSESGATSSNRFSVGDTGTSCSATQSASAGGFLATFTYTDAQEQQHSVSVAGVVSADPVSPSPSDTDNPWVTPSATASPTSSPGTHPSHSPTPSRSRTATPTSLPSTGGNPAQLPTTGADPRLVGIALTTTTVGVLLVLLAARPAPGRRQR